MASTPSCQVSSGCVRRPHPQAAVLGVQPGSWKLTAADAATLVRSGRTQWPPSPCPLDAAGTTVHNMVNTDFVGSDFPTNPYLPGSVTSQKGVTREQCGALCSSTPGCVLYVHASMSTCANCCWLKNRIDFAARNALTGATSYIGEQPAMLQQRRCWEACFLDVLPGIRTLRQHAQRV